MIFVFGSNLAGVHGAGAAKYAYEHKGAEWGVGEGRTGQAYALPTKDENIQTRLWPDIERSIELFKVYAEEHPEEYFELTPIGCGLAGYTKRGLFLSLRDIKIPKNVLLSASWIND